MHKVDGALNKDGTYSFTTGHFSTYAIMSEEEANPSSIRLDGVEIYRSLKKNSGYVTIDGEKVYTSYSGKASRTAK